ncbi:MAG: hypothetical protein K8T91_23175 [Planctomycetes bacterium]|nr:hypothetical protein [Planctomycetota bacterium]
MFTNLEPHEKRFLAHLRLERKQGEGSLTTFEDELQNVDRSPVTAEERRALDRDCPFIPERSF